MEIDKRDYKTIGDAVGMPDHIDRANVKNIIDGFEKENPGVIAFHRGNAKRQSAGFRNEFGEVDKNSRRRYVMEIPPPLYLQLEAYMPTIFREKKHFRWLVKNFKELVIPERY